MMQKRCITVVKSKGAAVGSFDPFGYETDHFLKSSILELKKTPYSGFFSKDYLFSHFYFGRDEDEMFPSEREGILFNGLTN